ncbi:MAG: hypothetical protein EA370_10040 [Wenzhouxiangella sp.]|nr:MAG: hypothetical protein EA370_10040 [Wenzhouxiangella sp.]
MHLAKAALIAMLVVSAAPLAADEPFRAEQRLACHIALEDVRWQARIWPVDNPKPKPARRAILSDEVIQARVERSLQMELALRELYGVRIEAEAVQAEINRILRASRAPAALADLLVALDHDPRRVAECLARPLLVERRLRNAYARDQRWHGALLDSIQAEIVSDRRLRETDTHFVLDHEQVIDEAGQPVPERA